MLAYIQKTIDELKAKIKFNIDLINLNQQVVKNIHQLSGSLEQTTKYETFNKQNKELLSQNNDLIKVQLMLTNFVEKYKNTAVLQDDFPVTNIFSVTDLQEVLNLTIYGILSFDKEHPYYANKEFIGKLVNYYKLKEEYELCEKLMKHSSSLCDSDY